MTEGNPAITSRPRRAFRKAVKSAAPPRRRVEQPFCQPGEGKTLVGGLDIAGVTIEQSRAKPDFQPGDRPRQRRGGLTQLFRCKPERSGLDQGEDGTTVF
ncbi:hypothetical protein [Cereibacter changlensis]|uniref:hypothetical protein n=1 Tax=Cereibacter changlensis TaxID=402884 RepID=UPI00200A677C|nr:hypothetical protein [Cereibacter changlensis]